MQKEIINILAISGSLRNNSSNNAVLRKAAEGVPDDVIFRFYEGLGKIPPFDDNPSPAEPVKEFRKSLRDTDGVIICSPEYAFGVPGSLKNALDWTVSSGEFVNKPTALITAATGGSNAHAALLLTFTALSANIPDNNKLLIPFVRSKMNTEGELSDPITIEEIQKVVIALIENIKAIKNQGAIL